MVGARGGAVADDDLDRIDELGDATPETCRGGHDRNAEALRERVRIDFHSVPDSFVDEVEGDDDVVGYLEHLQHEAEVPLQLRRVDHHDSHVGSAVYDRVVCHLFFGLRGDQRVGAR